MTDEVANLAAEHLSGSDPTMAGLVERIGLIDRDARRRGRSGDAFGVLLQAIIGQQVSVAAARAVRGRLEARFGVWPPPTSSLLGATDEELRSCGLSRQKSGYARDLAGRVGAKSLVLDDLAEASDADVITALTAVKGIGTWTAEMFLIFHLDRPDVLPLGDLGVRRAVERAYATPDLTPARLVEIAEPWRPYRSTASLYLWESLDNAPA
jgi:DNA-3-methyladenine glycosylase II